MNWLQFSELIISNLTDDLLNKKYRQLKGNSIVPFTTGHCYVASEVAYHLLGGKEEGWIPQCIKHEGVSHWFLKHKSGYILDLTYSQFKRPVPYQHARGTGFLTKQPSKRAKKLIDRINNSKKWAILKNSVTP